MKIFSRVVTLLIFILSVYAVFYLVSQPSFSKYLVEQGLGPQYPLELSGTGSMYPTFPKGVGKTYSELSSQTVATASMYTYPTGFLFNNARYYSYSLQHGDIISFENDITRSIIASRGGNSQGFVKRIIGLAGDQLEIRDGSLLRNGTVVQEPYIARARSTFGGSFLRDCKVITVPSNTIFVMGDNRKGSNDSRHQLGFVSVDDIDFVLPLEKQTGIYDKHWRDTSRDELESSKIHLDKKKLVDLINEKRADSALRPLTYTLKLERSAEKRGSYMIANDDFSTEATRSGYTMAKALKEVGYSNILLAEAPIQGYYEYDELYEALFEFGTTSSFLLEKDYEHIGIAEVDGSISGCPTRVIVIHIGGYRPPNYTAEYKESWKKALSNLKETYPAWEQIKQQDIYSTHKADIDRLLQIFVLRIDALDTIVAKIERNEWLSEEQLAYLDRDAELAKEQHAIIEKLLAELTKDS